MNTEIYNVIEVKNLSKRFFIPHEKVTTLKGAFISFMKNIFKKEKGETFNALDNISFEVKKGEFFGIIGRNGSGKSTLLKVLAGIYAPDKGYFKIKGRISPFLELGIGFNPELSGRDNIYLNATVLGLTKKQIDEKFDSIVEFSELERFIDQKLKNYSSGMSVRLAFSVAIHANRDILLMDEVLAVGDTNFQSKCLAEFNKYRDQGKTVILVTHDISVVQRYCDRAILLRNGKIEMVGNPEEVGNAYIYQNISDEENRIFNEKNNPGKTKGNNIIDEQSKKEKKVEITEVRFLDKNGSEKDVFETGEDISIRVFFKQNKKVDILNFGLAIFNQENQYFFGVNTFIDKINTKDCINKSYCQINYKKIPLKTNFYYISFAIYGNNENIVYDYITRLKYFKVFSKDKNFGTVNIIYNWD